MITSLITSRNIKKTAAIAPAILLSQGTDLLATEKNKPNVLIIVLDDAGYNDFGFMGSKDIATPNIDYLANTGIICTDAHVSATVSGPSRAGILTGRYQQRNGYECNYEGILGLGLEEETFGDIFKRNGYTTFAVGKWHQGNGPKYHPNQRGFDHFYGFIGGSRSYFYNPLKEAELTTTAIQYNGELQKFDGYLTTHLADKACDFISENSEKPFLMYLAFNAVHTPLEATTEDLERFKNHPRQLLAAMTYSLDQAIGHVTEHLRKECLLDNTLIFFLSDNGGAHNNQSSNFPLKGFKGNKFEGGMRVPFFIRYGNQLSGDFAGLCSSLDLLPTAMAAAGINTTSTKKQLDGVNLIPYLLGDKSGNPHDKLYWRKQDMAAIRMGEFKLIRVVEVGDCLYNLKTDLGETLSLCEQEKGVYELMKDELKEWEKGLVNPLLWNEGSWNDCTREIHRDLMSNRPIRRYTPKK